MNFDFVCSKHAPKLLDGWSQTLVFKVLYFYFILVVFCIFFASCSTDLSLHWRLKIIKTYFTLFSTTLRYFLWKSKFFTPVIFFFLLWKTISIFCFSYNTLPFLSYFPVQNLFPLPSFAFINFYVLILYFFPFFSRTKCSVLSY